MGWIYQEETFELFDVSVNKCGIGKKGTTRILKR